MSVDLNHTIVHCKDRHASAKFLADLLDLEVLPDLGPFTPVETANGVTLDFADSDEIRPNHYAFLVTDEEFDRIFGRIREAGIDYWADPHHTKPGEINHEHGGRGVYFDDPNGHVLEAITAPYQYPDA
ncbi:glyoxalase/bleomycin resistance protein/dioxygenase superfamily protein [Saccharopolyspora erythraea NRRL 2338]|uniref:Glyoxalase/bleomycin resistance protein/dioxygenase n=2 Tax=Saccharopolyspora erythraea TaxID=1836 RepID=A4F7U7_SACEN|nr:VOC family protein [Saccharopolyspora erythraea]EQD85159.1 glyoxalase [Saccharopolyspora erythraea D]PFG93920.1 glyoxalase/bleomycin resistance protein/dioxygenase superfamily protein [Saccharopolyspora erythraea NRRL 2338]QRK90745.1 VOC family protein [Saccharopolyspora erythraea]CAM00121.1 glyoxalase/bleomycin resistance protein/dioxygenase [Saccharopolyspora erythraea NRRL 2338]